MRDVVTEDQAQALFNRVSKQYEDPVRSLVKVPLKQNQYDALVSLVYNIGPENFRKSSVLRHLNQGNYKAASDAFMMWVKSGGKFVQRLHNRRTREVAHFNR